jgi:cytoskeletal protein CcmA (bactofilin family)
MWGRKKGATGPIESLIGASAVVEGDVRFKGGLRIDGEVRGSVIADDGVPSVLVLSERAKIVGAVRAGSLVVNGTIEGPVVAEDTIELQPKARIRGELSYRSLEIHQGALVDGVLVHLEDERPGLKLASSKD